MELPQQIKDALEKNSVKFEAFEHEPVRTCEDAARIRGSLSSGCKTMILKSGEKYIAAILPGDKRIDFKKLEKVSGLSDLKFASEQETERATGLKPGGVAPFGFKEKIRAFIDRSLLEKEFVYTNASPTISIKFDPRELQKLNKGWLVDIVE